jgi:hypothetical protein
MADALEARGWTVWWDRKLIVGQSYDQVIEHELEVAKSVVVLWSKEAILSEWVKNEAAAAAERGILVPALIDNIKLPLEFRRRQTADLIDWDGDPSHSGFLALCDGIEVKAANVRSALPDQGRPPAPSEFRQGRPWMWILGAIAVIAVALAAGVYWGLMRSTQPSISSEVREAGVGESVEIADSVVGTYYGDVVADSEGGSQTGVTVTIAKVGKRRVRITSDYERLGDEEVELSTVGDVIVSTGGKATLSLDMDQTPPRLDYNPGGVTYWGQKR